MENKKKIDLLEIFKDNFGKIKETKFVEDYYKDNIQGIKRKDEIILDKFNEKLVTCIVLIQNSYGIEDSNFYFLFEILDVIFDNIKRKIGYILLLNPILNYLINMVNIKQNDKLKDEEKNENFKKEKEILIENLDSFIEKYFYSAKSTPYLIEIVDLYNEDNENNKDAQIKHFWINSLINGYPETFDKISKFYSIENIDINNLEQSIELIKNKRINKQ